MTPTLRFGRIAGIPVGMHWSALVIVVLVAQAVALSVLPIAVPGQPGWAYWAVGVGVSVLFVAGLLAHEPPSPKVDLAVAVAGPLTSGVVAAVAFGAALLGGWLSAPAVLVAGLSWLALMNLLLAVFNLLPGAPLDGGRVLRAGLWWRSGDRTRAAAAASRSGGVLGMLLIGAGVVELFATGTFSGLWLALVGWFLMSAAGTERRVGESRDKLARVRVRDVMSAEPAVVPGWFTVADFADTAHLSRQRTFPVVDLDGQVSGVVTLARLATVPPADRHDVRVRDVAEPLAHIGVVSPDATLADLVSRPVRGLREGGVPVMDSGHVVGLLTAEDVARAVELVRLAEPAQPARTFSAGSVGEAFGDREQAAALQGADQRHHALVDPYLDLVRGRPQDPAYHFVDDLVADRRVGTQVHLEQVAPGDDADQPAGLGDHRQSLDPLGVHQLGGGHDRGVRADGQRRRGHQLPSGVAGRLRTGLAATPREPPCRLVPVLELDLVHQVGFGHYADHRPGGVQDGNGAHPPLRQQVHDLPVRRVGVHRDDVGGHQVPHLVCHRAPPRVGVGMPPLCFERAPGGAADTGSSDLPTPVLSPRLPGRRARCQALVRGGLHR